MISSTTNSLIGKGVPRVRLPFHKVLVFQTIELSKSPLCAGEGESPPGAGPSLSQGLAGWWHRPWLSPEALPLSPGKAPRPLLRQGVVIGVILWRVKDCLPAKHKGWLSFKTSLEDQDSSHAAHGAASSLLQEQLAHAVGFMFSSLEPPGRRSQI